MFLVFVCFLSKLIKFSFLTKSELFAKALTCFVKNISGLWFQNYKKITKFPRATVFRFICKKYIYFYK